MFDARYGRATGASRPTREASVSSISCATAWQSSRIAKRSGRRGATTRRSAAAASFSRLRAARPTVRCAQRSAANHIQSYSRPSRQLFGPAARQTEDRAIRSRAQLVLSWMGITTSYSRTDRRHRGLPSGGPRRSPLRLLQTVQWVAAASSRPPHFAACGLRRVHHPL